MSEEQKNSQDLSIIQSTHDFSSGPIIYQNGKPDFETDEEKKKRIYKRLIELDLGFHAIVVVLLISLIIAVVFSGKFLGGKSDVKVTPSASPPTEVHKASGVEVVNSPIYINEQIVSIDKAFNSEPTNIRLTMNGRLKKEVLGFLPYYAMDKADEINIKLLTSVSYFGLEVGGDGEIVKSLQDNNGTNEAWKRWQDNRTNDYFRKLKKNRIKIFLTFKAFSNNNIEKLVRSPQSQQTFINNVLYQVSAKALDGVNLDFEYIGTPPNDVRDKFTLMISNLNQELKRQYPKSILTIDTFATAAIDNKFFDVELLSVNCDALVIMGYDFRTPKSSQAGSIAPLGGTGNNLNLSLNAYLEKVPAEKLILAVPYYGYAWPTVDGSANSAVRDDGSQPLALSYAEITDISKKTKINWDDSAQTPWFSYTDSQTQKPYVVHFENTRSLGIKYDLINKKNLQGIGIWSLGLDGRNTDLLQLIADKFAN